ncbi:MAG: hypothetical protein AABZ43_05530 [Planctomycetota bacterium]
MVNGILENSSIEKGIKDSIVRRESLIVKDARVYIQLVLDEGARNITNHNRYRELSYVLPKEVVYDEASKSIFYYRDNEEAEIGKVKDFLGFMPYIVLVEGVRIVSSPADAKLLISLNRDNQGVPKSVIHSEENMEATLSKKCGQCHILEYIFSHKKWVEEDILHAFNRMQMEKEERFTEDEQKIIDLFKKYQKGEIDKGKLAEFKSLKQIGEKDVVSFTEGVYMNSCVPCHNPSKITDVSLLYSKRRCKSIVNRLKEKEPSLFLQTDMDSLASYLWEIKLKPCEN